MLLFLGFPESRGCRFGACDLMSLLCGCVPASVILNHSLLSVRLVVDVVIFLFFYTKMISLRSSGEGP